jgi:hypothetical protein
LFWAFALGYVGDQEDPRAVLGGEHRKVKVIGDLPHRHDDHRSFVADRVRSAATPAENQQ